MMLKTIVIVQDFAHVNGGNAKVALSEAIALKNNGFRVILFSAVKPIEESVEKSGIEIICLDIKESINCSNKIKAFFNGLWNIQSQKRFNNILKSLNPQTTIIHFHGWVKALSSSLFYVTAKYNFKIVITLHDFFTICPNGGLFNYPANNICKLKPMSTRCQICNCDSRSLAQKYYRVIRQYIMNFILRKNKNVYLFSISNLTDRILVPFLRSIIQDSFRVNNPIEFNTSRIVDISKNQMYTFISRVSREKGIDMFCQAITNLGLKGQVIGDGPLLNEYKNKYPKIKFRGWCSGKEKEKYIKKTRCLVLASRWYETFGLVVAEMKSFGIPSIVPDDCAASEQIKNGINGLIFKSRDQESLEKSIMQMESSNLIEIQKNVVSELDTQYTIDSHIKKVIQCYNKILNADFK